MEMKRVKKKDAADLLFERRHVVGEWGDKPVEVDVRLGKTSVVSCRMPTVELDALEDAIRETGETISEYIRRAVTLRRTIDAYGVRVPGISSSHGPGIQVTVSGYDASFGGWGRVEDSQDPRFLVRRG